jgi:lysozyme
LLGPLVAACGSVSPDQRRSPAVTEGSPVSLAGPCSADTVAGIDVFDGQGAIDWSAVEGSGVAFALIKATQGTYDTQATFADNWRAARSAGLLRGAYHFFDPTEDGAAQAAHFVSVAGVMEQGDLPPVLDIECPDGAPDCLGTGAPAAPSASQIHERMWAFLREVEQATGKRPTVYTFASYFSYNGLDVTGLEAYPLFLSWVPDAANGATCADAWPTPPAPWSGAILWQYSFTGSVAGIAGPVDRDRFLGSLAALQAFARSPAAAAPGCP